MVRVLIVGADSLIGADLVRYLSDHGMDVLGTSRRPEAAASRMQLDLAKDDIDALTLPQVDLAVFASAMTRFADCRAFPTRAHRVNVEAPTRLAERLAQSGARTLLLSTTAVFDGSYPHVPCSAKTSAVSIYGILKSEAEHAFLSLGSLGSVVRLTKVLTPDYPLITSWISSLRAGRHVEAFADLTLAPISLNDVRVGVLTALNLGGIVQVSGQRDVTYLEVLKHIARRLGKGPELVHAASAEARGIPVSDRPMNTSLDTSLLEKSTTWRPPDPFALIDTLYVTGSR